MKLPGLAATGRLLLTLALAGAPALAPAQTTYKCKDERGRIQYTSESRPGCTDMSGKPVQAPKPAPPAAATKSTPNYAPPAAVGKAKSAPAAKPPAKQETPLGAPRADPALRSIDCRALKQQYDWLLSPAGRGVEMHEARVSQMQQAMRACN
jgi:hypothetical protein